MTRLAWITLTLAMKFPIAASAAELSFDFKDPKHMSSVVLTIDSPLEPVVATATDISGNVQFDPANPKKTSGKIVVDAASVQFPNPGLTATAHGPDGFDAQRHPSIEFAIKEIRDVRSRSSVHTATVVGDFTCRGVTKPLTAKAEVTHLPGKAFERHRSRGDLLVLRSVFKIKRSDFAIKPRTGDELLGPEIEVRLAIVGSSRS